jgi:hypothetical protein
MIRGNRGMQTVDYAAVGDAAAAIDAFIASLSR